MRIFSILIFAFQCTAVVAAQADIATARVVAFLTNAHTGKDMRAEDWLTKQTRSAEAFKAFGGLAALVRQSTARAERFGGLESVQVLDERKVGREYAVTAEVHFREDHRNPNNAAIAANEDMVWRFRIVDEGGKLLLDF